MRVTAAPLALDSTDWQLWFVQLSGWGVFGLIVGLTFVFMLILSVVLPRLSHRSVIQNALLGLLAIAVIGFGLLALLAWLTRR